MREVRVAPREREEEFRLADEQDARREDRGDVERYVQVARVLRDVGYVLLRAAEAALEVLERRR